MTKIKLPPFTTACELVTDDTTQRFLQCQIADQDPSSDPTQVGVEAYLHRELNTSILDELYDHLWLVAKKSSKHIDAIHEHQIKKRDIVLAENPGLHLVWFYDIVYLKPIPPCLLNHYFWHKHLLPMTSQAKVEHDFDIDDISQDCRTALGFLRSYSFLVLHESDFCIAQERKLIPGDISYAAFQAFMKCFRHLPDAVVSRRYQYGQFRLTRLNWAVRICRPKSAGGWFPWNYQKRYWQTGQYLQRFGAPLIFIFAVISVILSAMQVILAARGSNTWASFVQASLGFSVAVLVLSASIIASILLGVMGLLLFQGQFAVRMHWRDLFAKWSASV